MLMSHNSADDSLNIALPLDEVTGDQRVGAPVRAGSLTLGAVAGAEVGLWEMTAGAMRDIEADEFFVVVSGSGTVEFDDGSPALHLRPGSVARLSAGARTLWTVTETLRKVYVTPAG